MIEAIAWPIVGLILGIVAIVSFRGPLVRKIERISRATKEGITFDQSQDQPNKQPEPLSFDDLMKQPISAAVLEREKFITDKLATITLKSETEKIAVLIRALASIGMDADFKDIGHIIFGSQVTYLIQLSGTRSGLPKQSAELAFQEAKSKYPDFYSNRTPEQWIGYLLANKLVKPDEEYFDITQHGSDFLKFLVDARLAHERYG